jgi:hypothetical protein
MLSGIPVADDPIAPFRVFRVKPNVINLLID